MQQDGSTVTELLTLNTDADSSSAAAAAIDTSEHIDTTLEQGHIEIAMHADEYYIFPLQRKLSPSDTLLGLTIGYSRSIAAPNEISASTLDLFIGELDPGFQGMLLLFNQKTSNPDTLTQGLYVLMRTDRLLPSPDDLSYFNMWCTIAQHPNESDKYHLISSNLQNPAIRRPVDTVIVFRRYRHLRFCCLQKLPSRQRKPVAQLRIVPVASILNLLETFMLAS